MTPLKIYFGYAGNSMVLVLGGVLNRATRAAITDADGVTISAQVYPVGSSTAIAGGPLVFTYQSANKEWIGVIPSDFALTKGSIYEAEVTMDGGTQLKAVERLRFKVVPRYAGDN